MHKLYHQRIDSERCIQQPPFEKIALTRNIIQKTEWVKFGKHCVRTAPHNPHIPPTTPKFPSKVGTRYAARFVADACPSITINSPLMSKDITGVP